jgi:cystathionine beta-lyase/cystathionine gamma-synthase
MHSSLAWFAPTYPVFINGDNTGVMNCMCSLQVSGTENVINQDTSDYTQIDVAASLGSVETVISVKSNNRLSSWIICWVYY